MDAYQPSTSIGNPFSDLGLADHLVDQGFEHAPMTDEEALIDPPLKPLRSRSRRQDEFNRNPLSLSEQSLTIRTVNKINGFEKELTASYPLLYKYIDMQPFLVGSPYFRILQVQGLVTLRSENNVLYNCKSLSPELLRHFEWFIEGNDPFLGGDGIALNISSMRVHGRPTVIDIVSTAQAATALSCESLLHAAARYLRVLLSSKYLELEPRDVFQIYRLPELQILVKNHLIKGLFTRRISKEDVSNHEEFQNMSHLLRIFRKDWDELSINAMWQQQTRRRQAKQRKKEMGASPT
ncbi:MAG: hypothetical protein Q9227_007472 [Pyrenula ochraceoflavens]